MKRGAAPRVTCFFNAKSENEETSIDHRQELGTSLTLEQINPLQMLLIIIPCKYKYVAFQHPLLP